MVLLFFVKRPVINFSFSLFFSLSVSFLSLSTSLSLSLSLSCVLFGTITEPKKREKDEGYNTVVGWLYSFGLEPPPRLKSRERGAE